MAAVEPDVEAALADGRLRRDLYERLAILAIEVPPLRRRRGDIPALGSASSPANCGRRSAHRRSDSVVRPQRSCSALPWRGNAHGVARAGRDARPLGRPGRGIQLDDVLEHVRLDGVSPRVDVSGTLRDAKARFERDWISAVLMKHQGRVEDAARALGIQRTNLYRKVRQLKVARTLPGARPSSPGERLAGRSRRAPCCIKSATVSGGFDSIPTRAFSPTKKRRWAEDQHPQRSWKMTQGQMSREKKVGTMSIRRTIAFALALTMAIGTVPSLVAASQSGAGILSGKAEAAKRNT